MKISFVLWDYPAVGGVERVVESWTQELDSRGHEVQIIARSTIDSAPRDSVIYYSPLSHHLFRSSKDFSSLKSAVKSINIIILKRLGVWKYLSLISSRFGAKKAFKIISNSQIVIISRPDSFNKILEISGNSLKSLTYPTLISQFHSSLVPFASFGIFENEVNEQNSYIQGYTALSPVDAEFAEKNWGKPAYFLPNPLPNAQDFRPSRFDNSLVMCCRLVKEKGVKEAIDIFEKFIKMPDFEHWKLDIFGDGPEKSALEQYSKLLGLSHSIFFHGFTRDVPKAFSKASMNLVTSKFEGRCITIMEAAAAGIPTIAYVSSNGVRDLVDNLEGYPVVPENSEEFLSILIKIASNKNKIQQNSNNIMKLVQQYHPSDATEKLLEIIYKISEQRLQR